MMNFLKQFVACILKNPYLSSACFYSRSVTPNLFFPYSNMSPASGEERNVSSSSYSVNESSTVARFASLEGKPSLRRLYFTDGASAVHAECQSLQ